MGSLPKPHSSHRDGWTYENSAEMAQQLGLIPAPGAAATGGAKPAGKTTAPAPKATTPAPKTLAPAKK